MNENRYPTEVLDYDADDGTMPESLAALSKEVIGHRIVSVEKSVPTEDHWGHTTFGTAFVLDNGKRVIMVESSDCCAFTELEDVKLNLDRIDHVITGVGTTDGYEKWHIYADLGDVAELKVGWSCGNPFYYGYGFDIIITDETTKG